MPTNALFQKKITALLTAAVLVLAVVPCVHADSQYVSNDKVYARRDTGTVYISDDQFLYNFSGEIEGVTVCGYTGNLRDIEIPEEINGRAVSAIDKDTFAGNKKITSVTIPPSVVAIGEGSFNNCENLETVTLSGGVQVLDNVFCSCPRIKSISFPYGVTEINNSFHRCASLSKVTFSRSVSKLGDGSFNECGAIREIEWSTGLSYLGDVFDGSNMLSTIHIPKGIVVINGAFDNCAFAEVLELPDSLLYLNSGFNGCTSLRRVAFPEGLVFIGDAFRGCSHLSQIRLPDAVVMDENAFADCSQLKIKRKCGAWHTVWWVTGALLLLVGGGWLAYRRRLSVDEADEAYAYDENTETEAEEKDGEDKEDRGDAEEPEE